MFLPLATPTPHARDVLTESPHLEDFVLLFVVSFRFYNFLGETKILPLLRLPAHFGASQQTHIVESWPSSL